MSIIELKNVGIYFTKPIKGGKELFWALKGINLSVEKGEVIGIIGPNGAGKTTLLSLIAGIYKPDKGSISVKGAVSPFLGLGVGFHPELTAEDNVYLYGSILGIKRSFIKENIKKIFEFAGLEGFEKMKLKYFSSGMYVRLGFSVSVMVEPDIFLIDEVLSVGDASFMRRSLKKIEEFIKKGKTVFIVSHDLGLIHRFANRVIYINKGRIVKDGSADESINMYLKEITSETYMDELLGTRWGTGEVQIVDVELLNGKGEKRIKHKTGDKLTVIMYYKCKEKVENPIFGINIQSPDGTVILSPNSQGSMDLPYIEGEGKVSVEIPNLPLAKGRYYLTVAVYDKTNFHPYDHRERTLYFDVENEKHKFTDSLIVVNDIWKKIE